MLGGLVVIFVLLFWLISFLVSIQYYSTQGLMKAFECGFEMHHWQSYQPSLHFFKLTLVFILFDLELMFLVALFFSMNWLMVLFVLVFLLGTLLIEFNFYSLNWSV